MIQSRRCRDHGLLALIDWSFARFGQAGLAEPRVELIDLDPEPDRCHRVAGFASPSGDAVVVGVCLEEDAMCRQIDGVIFSSPGKLCLVHELAHVWLAQNTTGETRQALLDHAGLTVWFDEEVPWHHRGVEYAAEALAWGLLDRPLRMIRIGSPDVEHLTTGFRILTGVEPIVDLDP